MAMTLARLITLQDAAARLEITEGELRTLIDSGAVEAAALPDGAIVISEASLNEQLVAKHLPGSQKYAHLKGKLIWLNEASRRYKIPQQTITRWVQKGILQRVSETGHRVYVDEAAMAYCAEVYHLRRGQGRWLFNRDGTLHQPKRSARKKAA
jgi:predicted site-specific integrase-resolvase